MPAIEGASRKTLLQAEAGRVVVVPELDVGWCEEAGEAGGVCGRGAGRRVVVGGFSAWHWD